MHEFSLKTHEFSLESTTFHGEIPEQHELGLGEHFGAEPSILQLSLFQIDGKSTANRRLPDLAPFTLKEGRRGRPGQPLERFTSAYSGEIHERPPPAPRAAKTHCSFFSPNLMIWQ